MERKQPIRQHCPACKRYVKPSSRYPNYVCSKCVDLAVDEKGRSVGFYNITLDGHGCQGKLMESGKLIRINTCYIKEKPFYAEEAHFGGIVLRPLPNPSKPKQRRKRKSNPQLEEERRGMGG